MAKIAPFHTNSNEAPPDHRKVYHDRDDCHEGKKIQAKHRESGTGAKSRCLVCAKLG